MRLLVVGGSGFIGRRVRASAGRAGAECFWTSTRIPPDPDAGWARLDLTQVTRDPLDDLLAEVRPDVVVNCVGLSSGGSNALVAVNVIGVATLLDSLQRAARPARLVHLGSAAEYGPVPVGTSVDEDGPTLPVSVYGATKLAGTRRVVKAVEAGRVDAVVLRIFNPVGFGTANGSVVGKAALAFREAALNGARSINLGPLDAYRDYIHVDDVVAAVFRAAERGSVERILNVGRGRAVQTRVIVQTLANIVGFAGEIVEKGSGSSRSNEVLWQQANVGLIDRELGWRATSDLRSALTDVVACRPWGMRAMAG